jgi:phosphoribosylformylglycinamidine synthase
MREQFARFFERADSFALGVCNGCQMLAQLKPIIPGAEHWPRFLRNRSEQYEARLSLLEVFDSPSIFLRDMAGARIPVAVAHGEGRAAFANQADAKQALVALRYIDGDGKPAALYPANPNGSPNGIAAVTTPDAIAGLTTRDGRVTILMPHPERTLRTANYSWAPRNWPDDGPWQRIFRNARKWVG